MFKRLRIKLTVLYVALFVAALSALSGAVYVATSHNVERMVREQLAQSGTVFSNLSATRTNRLQDEAGILAHDFGFRAAVATGDRATIKSALDNLAARFGINVAFVVGTDGQVTGQDDRVMASMPKSIIEAIQSEERSSGVFTLNGVPYEAVVAPILTPAPAGWVVFATVLSPDSMASLSRLSTIPLKVAVLGRAKGGDWAFLGVNSSARANPALQALINHPTGATAKLAGPDGVALTLVQALPSLDDKQQTVLLLRSSMNEALRPYYALGLTILAIGLLMVAMVVWGSWLLARNVTRPISDLEYAARKLQRGETARVVVKSNDEIARLGRSFNAMADDIEERTASLQHARDAAESANKAKSVFLANMNHEVRTPLNGVLGVAGMLASTPLNAGQRQMVEIIEASGAALNRLLNDILDMVDAGSDTLELIKRPFDLGMLMRNLVSTASANAEAKGLTFSFEIDSRADGWFEGDQARVEQILTNLLDNAVKFTEQGDVRCHVGPSPDGSRFEFEIRDTGIGFDQAAFEGLFSAFSQADGSMTRRAGGTGLGLGLARDIARAMGGEISGEGVPGQGATFVISLPLTIAEAPQSQSKSQISTETTVEDIEEQPPIRILLAEDHPANRKVIEMILTAVDVELLMVENGEEAVHAYKSQSFDAILMDLQMPVMDGLTAIKLIREHEMQTGHHTPILVISANVQSVHLKASADAGADSHLAKPIMAPTLIAALEQALASDAEAYTAAA